MYCNIFVKTLNMFTISFNYNGNEYNALVTEKIFENKRQYRVTIMNGDLEKLLHGNNVLIIDDTENAQSELPSGEKEKLLSQIRSALIKHFRPVVAS